MSCSLHALGPPGADVINEEACEFQRQMPLGANPASPTGGASPSASTSPPWSLRFLLCKLEAKGPQPRGVGESDDVKRGNIFVSGQGLHRCQGLLPVDMILS